ncbi:ACP S-malonyltransferase [Lacicoccus alkaliphilus]|uniref:Malonyl CoA-acyl carrier protein transacylase n=1 Tax=Lacicoccus alkaliphilus DSM 16010 TaxID=1123231 RepID=A0A1M7CA85_9BACL|nr:ACP S-malonyltransferase [Salinicoccus alkaliphilus]SHL63789.1 [acyl-carrier-protein] S-malonyltransferase [Salinicoccus alkaliphilus DSM 16010]
MSEIILFPGQGAQYSGMAKDLYGNDEAAKEVLDGIFSELDFDLKAIMFEEDERLNRTEFTQPALFAHSLAVTKAAGLKGEYVLGHSLGELPALVHAGVLSLGDGARIVQKRGELMSHSEGGKMAAVIGMDHSDLVELCESVSNESARVAPANINAPDQVVVSGDAEAVDAFSEKAKEAGARRVMPLNVSGAFHSHLMKEAQKEFETFVEDITFNEAEVPVIQNVSARPETDGLTIKRQLVEQITHPVRFVECIESAAALGVTSGIEAGPKKVLSGLVRKIDKSIKVKNLDTLEQVKEHVYD